MFKLAETNTIWWPVKVSIPLDGGKVRNATFSAEFEILEQKEQDELYAGGGNDVDLVRRVFRRWKEDQVQGPDGAALAVTDEAKESLIQIQYVRAGIIAAYLQASFGREAARKN